MGTEATKAAKLVVSLDAQEFVDQLYQQGWDNQAILTRLARQWPERARSRHSRRGITLDLE